jgi:hypothetical protein
MDQEVGQFYDYRNVSNNYPIQGSSNVNPDNEQIKEASEKYLNHYVTGHLTDGRVIEGIILNVDNESVTILVVEKDETPREDDSRQMGRFPGFFRFRPFRFPFRFFRRPFFTPFIFPFFWI